MLISLIVELTTIFTVLISIISRRWFWNIPICVLVTHWINEYARNRKKTFDEYRYCIAITWSVRTIFFHFMCASDCSLADPARFVFFIFLSFNCTWHGIKDDAFLWPFHLADDAVNFEWLTIVHSNLEFTCFSNDLWSEATFEELCTFNCWHRLQLNAFWKCHFLRILTAPRLYVHWNGMFGKSTMIDSVWGAFSINI